MLSPGPASSPIQVTDSAPCRGLIGGSVLFKVSAGGHGETAGMAQTVVLRVGEIESPPEVVSPGSFAGAQPSRAWLQGSDVSVGGRGLPGSRKPCCCSTGGESRHSCGKVAGDDGGRGGSRDFSSCWLGSLRWWIPSGAEAPPFLAWIASEECRGIAG